MRILFFIFAMLIPLMSAVIANAGPKDIRMGADLFCPFNCEPGGEEGFFVEVMKEVLQAKGYSVKYEVIPWIRATKEVANGKLDILIGAMPTENGGWDPPGIIYTDENIGLVEWVYAGAPDKKWAYAAPNDLQGKTWGWVKAYEDSFTGPMGVALQKIANDSKLVELSSGDYATEINLKKFIGGRVNVVVEDRSVLNYLIEKNKLKDKIMIFGNVSEPKKFFAGISPVRSDSSDLKKIIDQGIRELKKTGRLAAIFAKYGVSAPK